MPNARADRLHAEATADGSLNILTAISGFHQRLNVIKRVRVAAPM